MSSSELNIINVNEAIERLKSFLNIKTDAELAVYLDVSYRTISGWKYRNSIDIDLIALKCSSINLDWLLLGRETHNTINNSTNNDNEFLLEENRKLKKEIEVLTIKIETLKELLQDFSGQKRRIDLRATGSSVNDSKNIYAAKYK